MRHPHLVFVIIEVWEGARGLVCGSKSGGLDICVLFFSRKNREESAVERRKETPVYNTDC